MTLKLTCESCGREFFVQAEEAWTFEILSDDGVFRGYECRECADLFTREPESCPACGDSGHKGPCHTP
jgi:rubrerythrin